MSLNFMSAGRQEELVKIAGEVIDTTVSETVPPSVALHKVAMAHNLNRDEVTRLAEAYNTSAQLSLMKRAEEDTSVEADDVIELVDSQEVIDKMYPGPEGDKKDDTIDPGEYEPSVHKKVAASIVPETQDFNKPVAAPMRKTASVAVVGRELPAEQVYDQLVKKAENQISALSSQATLIADEAAQHKFAALRVMNRISEELSRTDATDFSRIEKQARYMHDGMKMVCDMVYNGCSLADAGHGRHTGDLPKYASVDDHADTVAQLVEIRDHLGLAHQKYAEHDELLTQIEKARFMLRDMVCGGGQTKEAFLGLDGMGLGDIAGKGEEVVQNFADEAPTAKPNDRLVQDLENSRVQMTIGQLTNNDPVLREYSNQPGALENAYNEIITMQPGLVSQPIALRAAMRRHLSSGGDMSLQEAAQIRDMSPAAKPAASIPRPEDQ